MTATISDREELCIQCVLSPECDTARLVYADWLDEQPTPSVRKQVRTNGRCPQCGNLSHWRRGVNFEHEKRCGKCDITWEPGEEVVVHVPDDTDARHAELLRASVELGRYEAACDCEPLGPQQEGTRRSMLCEACCEQLKKNLINRVADLTATLRDRLLPPCPMCKGSGESGMGQNGDVPCPFCDGNGVCPGEIVRGLPIISVPLAVLGEEVSCPHILGGPCSCNNTGHTWHPSDFARSCVRRGIGVRVTDREPLESQGDGHGFYWSKLPDGEDHPHRLPGGLYDHVLDMNNEWDYFKFYPTPAAAHAALGAALVRMAV